MKFLKSLICLLLVLSMVFCLAACGDDDKSDKDDKNEKIENVDKDDEDEKDTKDSEETTEKEPEAPKAEAPSGTYVLYKMEYLDEVVTSEDLGIEMAFTFNDDGSGEIYDGQNSEEFEWEGNVMTDNTGDTLEFDFVDGELIVDMDGVVMYFH